MTTQYAVLKSLPNGLALDAGKLFTLAAPDTVVTGNTFSFSNRTNANTQYVVSIVRATALPAGDYTFIAYIGTSPKAEVALTFTGVDGETAVDTEVQQLNDIEDSVAAYIAGVSAVASTTTGTIVGFPTSLNVGDSYTEEANADIHVFIRDENDDPITAVGDFNFSDPEFAPEVNITQSGSTGRVKAVVTFVDATPEDYLKVEIPSSQSRRASPGTATIQCLLKWVDADGKVLAQKTLTKQAVTWNEMV